MCSFTIWLDFWTAFLRVLLSLPSPPPPPAVYPVVQKTFQAISLLPTKASPGVYSGLEASIFTSLLLVIHRPWSLFLLRWPGLITLGKLSGQEEELNRDIRKDTQAPPFLQGLSPHLACSDYSQAVCFKWSWNPIPFILVRISTVFGDLFIKGWQVSANQRRLSTFITAAGTCPSLERLCRPLVISWQLPPSSHPASS